MKISQKDVLAIKSDTKQMLVELVTNLLTKTPLNYGLVRNMRWLDPRLMCNDMDQSTERLKRCLRILTDANFVLLSKCDIILQQFREFAQQHVGSIAFQSFKPLASRLDVLLYDAVAAKTEWHDLWLVVRKLLLLSHGQASVERGVFG